MFRVIYVMCYMSLSDISCVICHVLLYVMCYMACVMCNMSCCICHELYMSCINYYQHSSK